MKKSKKEFSIKNLTIIERKISETELLEFLSHVAIEKNKSPSKVISFAQYIEDKFYSNEDVIIAPDISGMNIGGKINLNKINPDQNLTEQFRKNNIDLSGVDFSGTNLTGTSFSCCNLDNAIFCDSDLKNASFTDCFMNNADLRGASIGNCKLDETHLPEHLFKKIMPGSAAKKREELQIARYKNVQFSLSDSLFKQYSILNDDLKFEAEEKSSSIQNNKIQALEETIKAKQDKLNNDFQELGDLEKNIERLNILTSFVGLSKIKAFNSVNKDEYNKLEEEISKLQRQKESLLLEETPLAQVDYVIHPSILYLNTLGAQDSILKFDPAYKRGASKKERAQTNQYVKLTRADAQKYLKEIKNKPKLSINDFAKSKLRKSEIIEGANIIADFSIIIEKDKAKKAREAAKIKAGNTIYAISHQQKTETNEDIDKAANYTGTPIDLSGLDFSNANLEGACFLGANFTECKFNDSNLDNANFEGADFTGSNFTKCSAKDTNLRASILDQAQITTSKFDRTFMPYSMGLEMNITDTNLQDANISNGLWEESKLDGNDMRGIIGKNVSLAHADIRRCKLIGAQLDNAILDECKIIECNLNEAILNNANAIGATIEGTRMQNMKAKLMNLSQAKIDKLCELEGANLKGAIMHEFNAIEVDFRKANLEGINAELANFKGANLEGVNLRLSNLKKATIAEANLTGADLTYCDMEEINARNSNLTKAILDYANAPRSHFEGANLEKAKLKWANLFKAKLNNAKLHKAIVNASTDLRAETKEATGTLINEKSNGEKRNISVTDKKQQDLHIAEAKTKNKSSIALGNAVQAVGKKTSWAGEFIKQPLSTKWGRIIGGAAGAIIATTFLAATVLSAGLTIPVAAAVIGGIALTGGAIGAAAGHYGAKHTGASTYAGAAIGFLIAGPEGAVAGLGVAVGANKIAKEYTGYSIDEAVGGATAWAGKTTTALGEKIGLTKDSQELLQEYTKAKEQTKTKEQLKQEVKEHKKVRITKTTKDDIKTKVKKSTKSLTKNNKKTQRTNIETPPPKKKSNKFSYREL